VIGLSLSTISISLHEEALKIIGRLAMDIDDIQSITLYEDIGELITTRYVDDTNFLIARTDSNL